MSLSDKIQTALDENRLLILGAQVLFGFQLQAVFQDLFAEMPLVPRAVDSLALVLMALTIGLLIAPSLRAAKPWAGYADAARSLRSAIGRLAKS
jgi:hypothetical protein